jgi:hypothetical protein
VLSAASSPELTRRPSGERLTLPAVAGLADKPN